MYTPRLTHHKIREMSDKADEAAVELSIEELAAAMRMSPDVITEHIVVLKALGLVQFTDEHKEFFMLTEKGRITGL